MKVISNGGDKVTPGGQLYGTYGKGLSALLKGERLDELDIRQMVTDNTDNHETAFTVSVDYKTTRTGISAERARNYSGTALSHPRNLRTPSGACFPLRYQEGGVLRQAGHTEATVDAALLAGLYPAGVCCEIMNDDGTMAGSRADRVCS